jgi:hypothetical protein
MDGSQSNVLQYIALAVAAFCAYQWLGGWPVAAGVVLVYFLATSLYRSSRARSQAVNGALIVARPLSDAEKTHLGVMRERDQRMAERQATKTRSR